MTRKWLAVLPAGLGLIVAVLIDQGAFPLGIYRRLDFIAVDIATLAILVGLVLSLLAITAVIIVEWGTRIRRQAADERRRFLALLDHELKNPLNAIQAGIANLADAPNEPTREEALTSIKNQTMHVSKLVITLRKVAELEERPLEAAPVDVTELLQEIQEQVEERPELASRHLTFSVPMAPWPLPCVYGDRDLCFAVINNLLDNALKFTQPGDRVEVRAFENGANVVVEVADTGPGIPDKELAHVWEELFRGEAAQGVPGSGLGLAFVRAVIKRHRAQVSLRSCAGQGTIVSIQLPKAKDGTSNNTAVTRR